MRCRPVRPLLLAGVLALAAAGCSTKDTPRSSVDYRDTTVLPSLVVPPDLTSPDESANVEVPGLQVGEAGSRAGAAGGGGLRTVTVLPEMDVARLRSAGDVRWLQLRAEPGAVYPLVREFWLKEGYALVADEPYLGRMETDWAKSKPGLKGDWAISRWFQSLSQADYRDKFRTWLERGEEPGLVNVYVAHIGLEREVIDPDENPAAFQNIAWQTRAPDHFLESEMLVRLAMYLGASESRAREMLAAIEEQEPRAVLVEPADQPGPALLVREPVERAWALLLTELNRSDLTLAFADKASGRVAVGPREIDLRLRESKDPLSGVEFPKGEDGEVLPIYLQVDAADEATTRVWVTDAAGAIQGDRSARRFLEFLGQGLR